MYSSYQATSNQSETYIDVAYEYLSKDNLKDALNDSETYMKPHYEPLDELERITDGRPGRVPKGKPRVTDGTLAGYKRETPKQVIQQLPTGKVTIRSDRTQEESVSAILTDVILPNANAGGTPYDKAKMAIEDCYPFGSAWFHCFYDRRGDLFHANYKLENVRLMLFEKGKTSEFDSNFMGVVEYMTATDIKAVIWQCGQAKKAATDRKEKYESIHDLTAWNELLETGASEKDSDHKTAEEKKNNDSSTGYFKTIKWMQIGKSANFYRHAPKIDKILTTEVNKDERGVIPIHGLVPAPSRGNPLGRPLADISAGKQNLLDFRMQMEQYREGMSLSPTLLVYGNNMPNPQIRPDGIIRIPGGLNGGNDVKTLDIATSASRNYANDSSYIKTQIFNEQGGSNDSSVGAAAGATGFSKTASGVKQQEARTNVNKDDMRRLIEAVHGRVFETLINIHMIESRGKKTLELRDDTMKRLKLQEDPTMNYDQELGTIKFTVTGGTSQAADNERESEKLAALQEIKFKMPDPDEKDMRLFNQVVKNAGVDEPETLMYTDDELEYAKQKDTMKRQMTIESMQMQQAQAKMQFEQTMNPQPPQPAQPVQGEVMPPQDQAQPDPLQQDRDMALQMLMQKGVPEQQAEQVLTAVDQEQQA